MVRENFIMNIFNDISNKKNRFLLPLPFEYVFGWEHQRHTNVAT